MTELRASLAVIAAVLRKDLAIEWRSRQLLASMLVFVLLVILIFNFALDLDARARAELSAGVLWATFAFAGTLGLNRSGAIEKDAGAMNSWLLTPVDYGAVYLGKTLANMVFILIVALFSLPVYGVLYNVNLIHPGLLLVLALGSWGYSALGTLLAAWRLRRAAGSCCSRSWCFPCCCPCWFLRCAPAAFFCRDSQWPTFGRALTCSSFMRCACRC